MGLTELNKLGAAALLAAACGMAAAQTYPSKPVRVIVPYAPGSGVAVVTRLVTEELAKSMGQPFVHETRPGAGGTIATGVVATAPPDGYTLLANSSAHSAVPVLMQNLPFDTARDLAGVTTLAELPLVMVIARSKGIRNVKELIAAAKAKPGSMTFASAGAGTAGHLGSEKFRISSGFEALHIPFKSTTDGVAEVMAGRVDFVYTAVVSALGAIQDGTLVPLALSSKRSAVLPDVPAIEETGVANSGYSVWTGLLAPAKTPREILLTLHREIVKVLATPDMKSKMLKIGADPYTLMPEEFDALIRRELVENEKLVKAVGIKPQ
jgi:tripartite-type tricarboxylate transporter receptor subunit TctC